ncbi:MAG TPA: hypothetical protein VK971_01965 [Thiohalobacter sp.]|nr:hypothetical protein [Thiohalobacter sp.]
MSSYDGWRYMRGAGLLKVIVLIPLALVVLLALTFAFYEGRKAYWDYRVREMCEKNGGVFIKDKIEISEREKQNLGTVAGYTSIPYKPLADPDSPVYYVDHESVIRESSPRVTMWEETIYRRSNKSVLANIVMFRRSGGDFPTYAYPSRFSCPDKLVILSKREEIFHEQGG